MSKEPMYGDMPIQALAKFLNVIPEDFPLYRLWAHFGAFLSQYYGGKHGELPVDQKVVDLMIKSYEDEGHSGYSHAVVTQIIMEYLSGQMSQEQKDKVKELRVK